jgi:hypothetical protein
MVVRDRCLRRGRSDAGGFGFAVPANAVRALLDQARLKPS